MAWLITILGFASIVCIILLFFDKYLTASGRAETKQKKKVASLSKISDRSRTNVSSLLKEDVYSGIPAFNRWLSKFSITNSINRFLYQADSNLNVGTLLLISLVPFLGFLLLSYLLFDNLTWGMPAGIIFGLVPWFWLSVRRRKRLRKIEEQLPAAVDMMVRGLKAGLALTACMKNVAEEMTGPLAEEFEKTNAEYARGKDISDCLDAMSERTGSQDIQFFSTAIKIQRETGGNLAEVLDNISHITRERFALRRHVRTLTGEGRLSAIILLALPPVLFLVLLYITPEYILGFVGTKIGRYCFAGALAAELFAFLVIRTMIRIKI